jgi:dihydrofolate reductase
MMRSIIVAAAENGVIGREGQLPWRLSADLQRFKQLTIGHAVLMGRKTYESIGRPLPGRRMIVITKQHDYRAEGVEIARSLDEAYRRAAEQGETEAFIIGGAEIFREAMPNAERLYFTRVHAVLQGDTYFPPLDNERWKLTSEETHDADAKNEYPFTFEVHKRRHS